MVKDSSTLTDCFGRARVVHIPVHKREPRDTGRESIFDFENPGHVIAAYREDLRARSSDRNALLNQHLTLGQRDRASN